ncbi:MAG: hypothetical protein ABIG89_02595 [Candidatus Woesearchaeota archaeon]
MPDALYTVAENTLIEKLYGIVPKTEVEPNVLSILLNISCVRHYAKHWMHVEHIPESDVPEGYNGKFVLVSYNI